MLVVKGLTSHYGRIQALHGVDIAVRPGQLVALVGANGAGKTTLLRAISGVQPASGGSIDFQQQDISRLVASRRVRAGISQVPEGRQVFAPMSVEDNLLLGAFTRSKGEIGPSLAAVHELFPILHEKRHLPAGTLSGGQQQMLAMARALMAKPKLLLLDEPSMGLAPLIVQEIFRLIQKLRDQGITILVVEQNARAALSIADQGYVMELGRIVMSGRGAELLKDDKIRQAYLGM
ncbi:ABC transporter ATP-binding protein [Polaromonas sp.]|uniref:ABC transporter ATP-binding protein n=1 Tax=Polaromonas sp. TaxID=1869339 RepID=UPI002FCB3ADC